VKGRDRGKKKKSETEECDQETPKWWEEGGGVELFLGMFRGGGKVLTDNDREVYS